MQHEYILGANYWSQKWGTEMWRHYDREDEEIIDVFIYEYKKRLDIDELFI